MLGLFLWDDIRAVIPSPVPHFCPPLAEVGLFVFCAVLFPTSVLLHCYFERSAVVVFSRTQFAGGAQSRNPVFVLLQEIA